MQLAEIPQPPLEDVKESHNQSHRDIVSGLLSLANYFKEQMAEYTRAFIELRNLVGGYMTLANTTGFSSVNVGESILNGGGVIADITFIGPLPDMFDWSDTNGNSGTNLSADALYKFLVNGVSVSIFGAQNRIVGDQWDFTYTELKQIGMVGVFDGITQGETTAPLMVYTVDPVVSGEGGSSTIHILDSHGSIVQYLDKLNSND